MIFDNLESRCLQKVLSEGSNHSKEKIITLTLELQH